MCSGLVFFAEPALPKGMSSFTEKTLAEQNFGVCWRQQIAPLIARYTERRRRRMMFASLITGIAVGLGVVIVLLQAHIASTSLLAQPLYMALVLALGGLAVIGAWVLPLLGRTSFDEVVRRAVERHFASLFTSEANNAFGEVILQDLVTDGIIHDCEYRLTSHYAGTYGDCRVRMIEAVSEMARDHSHDRADLLVFRVSLPFSQTEEVRADSKADRLMSLKDSRPDLAPYDVDHDQLDGIFAVATTDIGAAARIFTDGFAETVLRIQERLANPLWQGRGAQPQLAMQVANGSFQMVVEASASGNGGGSMTPAGAEAWARHLIVQFAAAPALVDGLQGGADIPPAFAPLPTVDDPHPVVSI